MIISLSSQRRSAVAAAILVAVAMAPLGCKRHRRTIQTTEEAPVMSTVVATADPTVAKQLLSGFYGVEQNAWRWTAGRFSVVLRPPRTAATKGATLQLKFAIPAVALEKAKSLTLSAYVNGTPLTPETYKGAGQYTYTCDVPASMLSGGDTARIDFSVDHTIPPTAADHRELGIVVSMVGFQPK